MRGASIHIMSNFAIKTPTETTSENVQGGKDHLKDNFLHLFWLYVKNHTLPFQD